MNMWRQRNRGVKTLGALEAEKRRARVLLVRRYLWSGCMSSLACRALMRAVIRREFPLYIPRAYTLEDAGQSTGDG